MTVKSKLNKTIEYIENNLDQELNLQIVSDFNHYSKYHFSRIFLSEMNSSIMTYIRLRRIIRSKHTLLESNYKITHIAFSYGFNNIDTYIRSFKTVFGVTPTFYRHRERLSHTKIYKENIMTTLNEQIKSCSKEEKLSQLDTIQMILDLSTHAHQNGLFALEKKTTDIDSVFLCRAIELIVDGINPDMIRRILENYIQTSEVKNVELLERYIYLDGILLIQQGYYPWEIRRILISLLGEELSSEVASFFNTNIDYNPLFTRFMNQSVVVSSNLHLEKEIKHLNKRKVERITRECDLLTLLISSIGLNQTMKKTIVDSLSKRTQKNLYELYNLLGDTTLPQVIDAQNSMIQTIQQLRRDKDI